MSAVSTIKATLTTSAVILTSGVLFNPNAAQAAALKGSFQINNADTTINLSNKGIDFTNKLTDPLGEVGITAATGSFEDFGSAFIKDINFSESSIANFLDLSAGVPGSNSADGVSTFDLTSHSGLQVSQTASGILGINFGFSGFFTSDDNQTSLGTGVLTFQLAEAGITVESFQRRLEGGETFKGITFSGAAFAAQPVPESSTTVGLLAVAGMASFMLRKRLA
ncbi:MAG: PEP-CTERM sorting domain-containing protein [Roseofilum sp. SBFL]|uniref:PEP-CTERM sorting domain-containing protein n=1 Tax=Roseofilum sp. SBFL TaxID=2821496 RepID=UPI001B2A1B90|nr:PEP-CTERM sorting domain-containing protein [Roseofilum sp. SBFL]MBP0040967.1 PEP-CTERM sorting domain-containing protein [Roseofilum sp. SBFL]